MLSKEDHEKMQKYLRGEIFVSQNISQVTQENIDKWFSTKQGYYLQKRLSASFLKKVHSWENSTYFDKTQNSDNVQKRFLDGQIFENYVAGLEVTEHNQSLRILADKVVNIYPELRFGTTSQQSIFKGNVSGYKTKCKTDFECKDTIYELKSSNAKTLRGYEINHLSFMYDMQAYIQNSLSDKEIIFVVASKKNHKVWEYYPNYELGQKQFLECVSILRKYELHKQFQV